MNILSVLIILNFNYWYCQFYFFD